jgi:hypothetical protein
MTVPAAALDLKHLLRHELALRSLGRVHRASSVLRECRMRSSGNQAAIHAIDERVEERLLTTCEPVVPSHQPPCGALVPER